MMTDVGVGLCVLGILAFALAAHPFTTYPLSLHLMPRRPLRTATATGAKRAALCVCAYNEERVIRAKAENMVALARATPGLRLLIYVDAASDRTAEILREFAPDIEIVVASARHGKTHGMNTLVGMTDVDLIVFSDANVLFASDAVEKVLAPFADPTVGAVCGHLSYTGSGESATAQAGSLYWRLEERIKSLESQTGSCMGADGSIFAIRRALHQPPPPDLIDDMYVSLAILCAGWRVVRAADAHAFEDLVTRPGEEFRRKVRIACQAFNVHRALWPQLRRLGLRDRYKYLSHKVLRWMAAYLLGVSVIATLVGVVLIDPVAGALCILAAIVGTLVIVFARSGILATLRDVLGAFISTGIGIWRSLQGDRFQTWNPPASARATLGSIAKGR